MPRRLTNLLILLLVAAQFATGIGGWVEPVALATPLYDLHRALGVALLLVLLLWKQRVVRRSLDRRVWRRAGWDRSVLPGIVGGLALVSSVAIGLAWTLHLVTFDTLWGYSPLNLHVFLAFGVVPFLLVHLAWRWERQQTAPSALGGRRGLLRLGLLAGATVLAWRGLETVANLIPPAGVRRLPTGSKWAGSFSGNAFPVTIWLFDPIPLLDRASWTLSVSDGAQPAALLSFAELEQLPRHEVQAILDCTSGWWSEQLWQGAAVHDVLAASGVDVSAAAGRSLMVTSVTGHRYAFPVAEMLRAGALLATHVGGEPLSAGHGYPVRLVMPGRRGYQWVKWVARLELL